MANKTEYVKITLPKCTRLTSQVSITKRLCFKTEFSVLFSHLLVWII